MGIESESYAVNRQILRSVRSFAWNSALLPVIMERLERAESQIRAHMLLHNCNEIRLGAFEIELREDDNIHITRLEQSDWIQAELINEIEN